jgi:cardiolipin synthase A/B
MRSYLGLLLLAGCISSSDPAEPLPDLIGLPECASDQMHAIYDASRELAHKGSVSDQGYVTSRNRTNKTLLLDGPMIFPAMRQLIANARRDVNLQTYVWEPGSQPAQDILAGLSKLEQVRKANNATMPVNVRFLFDVSTIGYGSFLYLIPQAAAEIAALDLDPKYVKIELAGYMHAAMGNLHKKTLVVDSQEAIITGANPQAHHDYATPWRDSGYQVSGEVASALEDDFDTGWEMSKLWTCGTNEAGTADNCMKANQPIVREPVTVAYSEDACLPIIVTTRAPDANPFSNRTDNTQDQAFLAAFGAARHHIRIKTPNLNDDAAKNAVIEAVKRGVRVEISLSKGFNDKSESSPGQGGTNEENVAALYQLLGGRAACDKLQIRWHTHDGVAVVGNGAFASHAKYVSIDDTIAIVGSANMNTQSWNNSMEVNIVVDDVETTQAWDAGMFNKDFGAGIVVDQCK